MLRSTSSLTRHATSACLLRPARTLTSHAGPSHSTSPRPAVELDASFTDLFKAGDENLKSLKQRVHAPPSTPAELHVIGDGVIEAQPELHDAEDDPEPREERRSPAALFGSNRPGYIKMSEELTSAIQRLVDGEIIFLLLSRMINLRYRVRQIPVAIRCKAPFPQPDSGIGV